jgi:hypothetical protein
VSCIEQVIISVCEMNRDSPFVAAPEDDFAEADEAVDLLLKIEKLPMVLRN